MDFTMERWISKALFIICLVWSLPRAIKAFNNDVYPLPYKNESATTTNWKSAVGGSDNLDQLRNFFMTSIEDRAICDVSGLKDLIIRNGQGFGWWGKRCSPMSSAVPRGVPQSSKNKQLKLSPSIQKKLNSLLKKAQCQPIRHLVDLDELSSYEHSFVPCHVKVKRCSGCCNSDVLRCVPSQTRKRRFTVMKLEKHKVTKRSTGSRYQFPKGSSFLHKIEVLEHQKCSCECKERASDCSTRQEYNPHICKCVCPASSRRNCPKNMIWSENICSCICLRKKECSTGMIFNGETCTCEIKNSLEFYEYNISR